MKKFWQRLPVVLILLALSAWLWYGFTPAPVQVDIVQATRGNVQVTVKDDGKTRIREKYIVSAPVFGKLYRIELEEGDTVVAGQTVLARIEPSDPTLLDARARAEAEARVRAAESAVRQAEAALVRAREAHALAKDEFARARQLVKDRVISRSEFDEAEHRQQMTLADVQSAEFGASVAAFELDQARAALIRTQPDADDAVSHTTMTIRAPVDGQVLRVLQESASIVQPGTPLLEIGDPRDLEMLIDVLSADAVKIQPGAQVLVEHWGGESELLGKVRLVEPSGFLKISALGVEEQRVNVLADFTSPYKQRTTLGDNYRIEARIVVAEAENVIKVPVGTLFRVGGSWHVFRILNRRAALQRVQTGVSNGSETEITDGVAEGDRLILYPTDEIRDGSQIREAPGPLQFGSLLNTRTICTVSWLLSPVFDASVTCGRTSHNMLHMGAAPPSAPSVALDEQQLVLRQPRFLRRPILGLRTEILRIPPRTPRFQNLRGTNETAEGAENETAEITKMDRIDQSTRFDH